MEATGVYWKPVWQVLAGGRFELVLANAAHAKNVPGRKTDVNDATWLAELLAHGLIRASFVPGPEIQELQGLLRTRKQLVREKASHVQGLQKTLEEANIKLESVLSDGMGRSGRAMIQALIGGETDPGKLAALAHPKVRAPQASLREALRGRVKRHHRFLLDLHLQQIDALDAGLAAIDREVDAGLACFRDAVKQLSTIPGVSELSAQVILSEIGTDMSRFATAAHRRSWAGLCPCNDESAGKRRSIRRRIGAPWLKATRVQCGGAAARTKATYRNAQFVRWRTRRGPKKAVCAVAASILTAAYHMLKDGTFYEDLGPAHFDRRRPVAQARRLVKRLADLGFSVELKPAAAVS
jgi:transposase